MQVYTFCRSLGFIPAPVWAVISLGEASPPRSSGLPGTGNEASSLSSLFGLAPGGGYLAARITADAGGLLHHLFTIAACAAVCFCGPIRQVAPPRGLPGAVPYGVRTFLGRARGATAIARPA